MKQIDFLTAPRMSCDSQGSSSSMPSCKKKKKIFHKRNKYLYCGNYSKIKVTCHLLFFSVVVVVVVFFILISLLGGGCVPSSARDTSLCESEKE